MTAHSTSVKIGPTKDVGKEARPAYEADSGSVLILKYEQVDGE
jgi:hypothetical protein